MSICICAQVVPGQARGGSFKHESSTGCGQAFCAIKRFKDGQRTTSSKHGLPHGVKDARHQNMNHLLCCSAAARVPCDSWVFIFLLSVGLVWPVQELQAPAVHMTRNLARTFCVCAPPPKAPAYRYACVKHAKNKVELYQQIKANDAFSRNDVQSESLDPLGCREPRKGERKGPISTPNLWTSHWLLALRPIWPQIFWMPKPPTALWLELVGRVFKPLGRAGRMESISVEKELWISDTGRWLGTLRRIKLQCTTCWATIPSSSCCPSSWFTSAEDPSQVKGGFELFNCSQWSCPRQPLGSWDCQAQGDGKAHLERGLRRDWWGPAYQAHLCRRHGWVWVVLGISPLAAIYAYRKVWPIGWYESWSMIFHSNRCALIPKLKTWTFQTFANWFQCLDTSIRSRHLRVYNSRVD